MDTYNPSARLRAQQPEQAVVKLPASTTETLDRLRGKFTREEFLAHIVAEEHAREFFRRADNFMDNVVNVERENGGC